MTLSFESILAFRRVSHLVLENAPVILESRVQEDGIDDEIENACKARALRMCLPYRRLGPDFASTHTPPSSCHHCDGLGSPEFFQTTVPTRATANTQP